MERTGIGNQRGVGALSDLFRDTDARRFAKVVDHLADGGGSRVNPINGAKKSSSGVMVDVDYKLFVEIYQTRPRDVRTLDDEDRIVVPVNGRRDTYIFCCGQLLTGMWNWISHDHFDIFVECSQQPVQT